MPMVELSFSLSGLLQWVTERLYLAISCAVQIAGHKRDAIVPNIDPSPITNIEDILTPIRPSNSLPLPQSIVTAYDIIRSSAIQL